MINTDPDSMRPRPEKNKINLVREGEKLDLQMHYHPTRSPFSP
jgi:hypothetical protein